MTEPSKDTLISNLQQRMDKCTTEQFWAVAAMTALYVALISHVAEIPPGIPKWLIGVVLSVAAFYAAFFVIHRHKAYYSYRKDFAELLKDCSVAPQFMKDAKNPWELPQLTGIAFYCFWILGGYVVAMCVIVRC